MSRPVIERFVNMAEVVSILGLSRSTIYRGIKAGTFPTPNRISLTRIAWPESTIIAWKNGLPVSTPNTPP